MNTSVLENIIVTEIQPPFVVHATKGYVYETHNRPTHALSLCQSGQITYSMDGKKYVSRPGCAVLLPQNGCYSLYGDKAGLFPIINFRCTGLDCDTIVIFPLRNFQKCLKAFDTLNHLFHYERSQLTKYEVFYGLLHMICSETTFPSHRLQGVTEYIEKNLSSDLTNTTLAKQLNISEVYLRKQFLRYYNTTPRQYILDMKLKKAKQLLTDSTFSVTAIAEECGFSNVYYFCKIFREKTGMTPTEYASLNRIYEI